MESVTRAATKLLESGDEKIESSVLQTKTTELQEGWDEILTKSTQRQGELEAALEASHSFMDQMKEMKAWLNEASQFLKSRRPIGGRPESAQKQLNKHQVCFWTTPD